MTEPARAILITGASTGIGYYSAKALHQAGYRVIASCRKMADVSRLQAEGLTCIHLDLADPDSVAAAVEKTLTLTHGNLYALFNNGAYGQPGAVEDLTRETLKTQFETNFFGWADLTNRLLPGMIARGQGRIIHNSSVLGFAAMPFRGAYNASKFALEGLADTQRLELRGTGVHVSLIEPGPILSEFRRNALAALEANIDIKSSRHQVGYEKALERLTKVGKAMPGTLGPEAVHRKLVHALESRRPKPRYYVTWPTYLMGSLKRVLSTRMMDRVLARVSN